MIDNSQINSIISQGATFLKNAQELNGAFLSLSDSDKNFENSKKHKTFFINTLIALALSEINCKEIKNNLAKYILTQRSSNWSFNYWQRSSKEAKKIPYPDDLDDTACALSALQKIKPKTINGDVLAKFISILTNLEKTTGGPYKTWIVDKDSPKAWQDIDLAVNSNIAYFLSLQEVELPKINCLIEKNIKNNDLNSPYYASNFSVIYFISRFYRGKWADNLKQVLLSKINKNLNQQDLALALSSSINLDCEQKDIDKICQELLKISQNNSWQVCPFVVENIKNKQPCFSGSSYLTCALTLEALTKYKNKISDKDLKVKNNNEENYCQKVISEINKRVSDVNSDFRRAFLEIISHANAKDSRQEILLLPFHFRQSLGKNGTKIPDAFLVKLSTANLYGWLAYSIYDDYLDNDKDPKNLSIANFCLRSFTEIFQSILPQTGFYELARKILDQIDIANHLEKKAADNFRLNTKPFKVILDNIADKSLGQALGPIAILFYLGFNENSDEVKNILQFVKNYLIIRQLNDDMHDWENDLKNNLVSYPISVLLSDHQKKFDLSNEANLNDLRSTFWNTSIVKMCKKIFKHANLAKKYLTINSAITEKDILTSLVTPLEDAGKKALMERQKMLEFLNNTKFPKG